MTTYIHIDETTGEQLASVSRLRSSGESQVRLTPWSPGAAQGVRLQRPHGRHPPGHHAPCVLRPSLPKPRGHGEVVLRVLQLRGAMRRGARELARTHRGRHAVPRRAVEPEGVR